MIVNDKEFVLTGNHVTLEVVDKTLMEEKYVPSVIEPSFGIGRIVYCVFEHCFKQRAEDAQRTYFTFPPLIAPVKCSILPLMDKPDLNRFVQDISKFNIILIIFFNREFIDKSWYFIKD